MAEVPVLGLSVMGSLKSRHFVDRATHFVDRASHFVDRAIIK